MSLSQLLARMPRLRTLWPALLALLVGAAYSTLRLIEAEGNPATVVQAYDGLWVYQIALQPAPQQAAAVLDVAAYRYQRILYPLLSILLAFGQQALIPWAMLAISLIAHSLGTWAVAEWLSLQDSWPGYALIYGLWIGLVSAVGLGMTEALAYALVAAGWLMRGRRQYVASAMLLALAIFTKEPTAIFWTAVLLADSIEWLKSRERRNSILTLLAGGLAYGIWQIWLWQTFGRPGLGSGANLATPFEIVPFMGLLRIGYESLPALGLYLTIFGPTIILPTTWAVLASAKALLNKQYTSSTWAHLLNGMSVMALPFSTAREPLGLVRLADGLILTTIYFAVEHKLKRPLRYGMFWAALLVILLNR